MLRYIVLVESLYENLLENLTINTEVPKMHKILSF